MDRRTFILGTAAAAYHTSRLMARGMAGVELGSIDGSVGGNNFTPIQFLDYLSSIKLTWAMLSVNAATLGDEAFGVETAGGQRVGRRGGELAAEQQRQGGHQGKLAQRANGPAVGNGGHDGNGPCREMTCDVSRSGRMGHDLFLMPI